MITCDMLEAQLPRYLAGDMSSEEAEALELHAAECDRCGAIVEVRTQLETVLPRELTPDPLVRRAVLARVSARGGARRAAWWIPAALAASVLLAVSLTRPDTKSGQGPAITGSPAAIAAERADGEFRQLDAARAELRDALAKSPGNPMLQSALERLDAQRRSLENLIQEFES